MYWNSLLLKPYSGLTLKEPVCKFKSPMLGHDIEWEDKNNSSLYQLVSITIMKPFWLSIISLIIDKKKQKKQLLFIHIGTHSPKDRQATPWVMAIFFNLSLIVSCLFCIAGTVNRNSF